MPPDLQPSIASEGLKQYLDRTRHLHNGKGYDEFKAMLTDTSKNKPSKTQLSREMGVSRPTISKWITIYRMEKKHAK